jgi:alpha-L-rhamnosidase
MLIPVDLRCEYLRNPLGIDHPTPRLSWILESQEPDQLQSAYQILVADSLEQLQAGNPNLWASSRVNSDQSAHIVYAGRKLRSGMRCWWEVRVWDKHAQPSEYSQPAWWQMGLLNSSDWSAQWIWFDTGPSNELSMTPCAYLRQVFDVLKPVQRATLYATAKGLYQLHLNGIRVGDAVLSPGWTDYHKRIQYQAYDVTDLLHVGSNAIGAILGDGWYHGHVGHKHGRAHYGPHPQLLAQLQVEHPDSSPTILVTENTWKATTGPICFSDLLMGETYDARKEMSGWDRPDFDDAGWQPVRVAMDPSIELVADRAQPLRVTQEIIPQSIAQPSLGTYVFDLGQNMVGWARLRVQGEAGTIVKMRFAEVLDPDGYIHTENLRTARATDSYILKGDGPEVFEPHFTYHGFRYVELTGYPGEPAWDTITGCVVHSDLPVTGNFECSNPLVNQLWRNVLWSQRGNFLSVPTDCPQRDERLGWMGDAQLFAHTACLNMDAAAFFTKWMIDVEDAQSPAGGFSDVAPRLVVSKDGAPAWGDAGIIVPWTIYQVYGDRQIIERHYEAMSRWMAYIHEANPHLLRTKRLNLNFGDWVAFDRRTSKELIATAYWAYDALLMSAMAQAIDRTQDAARYGQLFEGIKAAFNAAYVFPDGRIEGGTQTAYVLALHVDLLPDDLRAAAAAHLVKEIQRRNWHLSTGFIGTAYLCPVLTENGYPDVAYRLLNNDSCPSWGHMVKHGATTIWERWNSWTAKRGLYKPKMNSFNHYAFGTVGEWLYRYVAGIATDPHRPGYQHILIRPYPGGGLTHAGAEYQSIRGRIASHWRVGHEGLQLDVSIPANTQATIFVPATASTVVTESGKLIEGLRQRPEPVEGLRQRPELVEGELAEGEPVEGLRQRPELAEGEPVEGVRFLRQEDDTRVFAVGSGDYHFVAVNQSAQNHDFLLP